SGISNTLQNLTINDAGNIILGNALNIIGIVTPTAGTLTTNGNLTLKSISITNTAIVASGNGTITGDVTVERFIPNNSNGIAQGRRAFRDLSLGVITAQSFFNSWQEAGSNSPNYGTQITGEKGISGNYNAVTGIDYSYSGSSSLFSYNINTTTGTASWDAIVNTKTTIASPFKGYRILIRGDRTNNLATDVALLTSPTTIRQKGQLISGNVSYTTTNVTANGNIYSIGLAHDANDAFTMIGNPYICPIDWVSISSHNNTILPTCYVWDPNIATYGAYVTYNSSSGSSNAGSQANRYIQPGQAFFIQNNNTTNPTFTIQESDKVAVQDATHLRDVFGENGEASISKINITLLKNVGGQMVNMDGAAMCYHTIFSNDITKEDAEKIDNNSECIAINSHAYLYSIEGKPTPLLSDSISLKLYYTTNNANYQLQVNLSQFTNLGLQPYLKDRFTKNSILLTLGTVNTYAFITTADTNSFNNRFTIIFAANTVLPIHFATVKAYANANTSNTITWLVNETTADYYEVEHATNTQNFVIISKLMANGNGLNNYTYRHNYNSIGNNYYRIKSVNKAGLTKYSTTEIVNNSATKAAEVSIYPNPIENGIVNIGFNKIIAGTYEVAIYNSNGKVVQRNTIVHNGFSGNHIIYLLSKLTVGIYGCSISNGVKNIHYQKLLVQ
ncbi:MAG: T9SS type A sorting domain-containing protein, partial [Pedobacter sp.]|nr:T9SS type A sorting domain-containing protein [Chitinophagaceae bacterium]